MKIQVESQQNQIKKLINEKEDLLDETQKLQVSNKELQDSAHKHKDIKGIFNKWGTYTSFMKDVAIVKYFMDRPHEGIRQKTIITYFKESMDKTTCRKHLYKLIKMGILSEPSFKGSYVLSSSRYSSILIDADCLARNILGENLFELAVEQHNKLYEKNLD